MVASPRTALKKHHAQQALRATGGTNNIIGAMFGMDDRKMCNVVPARTGYRPDADGIHLNAYIPVTTSASYAPSRTHSSFVTGSRRSDSMGYAQTAPVNLDALLKRAARKDMSLTEYCAFIGMPLHEYIPGIESVDVD